VWLVRDGTVTKGQLAPEDVGLARAEAGSLRGGDPAHNAEVTRRFLAGEGGPVREAVLLNAAAALVALNPTTSPLADQLRAALEDATRSVDSGAAADALDRWVTTSRALAGR
jgi:anthranilate phosphoribosyltransferase